MAQKATVTYASGLMLIMPNSGDYALSLLQWLAKREISILRKVIDESCNDQIKIRFEFSDRERYQNCADYLNQNSAS